uniref:Uncharacterized protein n=1 Tax=Rhizophora mucronata TaxID=61149 RepID=A0A2P2NSV8_RHIMU
MPICLFINEFDLLDLNIAYSSALLEMIEYF